MCLFKYSTCSPLNLDVGVVCFVTSMVGKAWLSNSNYFRKTKGILNIYIWYKYLFYVRIYFTYFVLSYINERYVKICFICSEIDWLRLQKSWRPDVLSRVLISSAEVCRNVLTGGSLQRVILRFYDLIHSFHSKY